MSSTVPEIAAVAVDFTNPAVQAHYIEQAADLIQRYGKHDGDWWPNVTDEHGIWHPDAGYQDGASCCTVGALAVSLDIRNNRAVHDLVCGLDSEGATPDRNDPHPVLAALIEALGGRFVEDVFDWSDSARADQVVTRLREIATQLRATVETPAAVA